MPCYRCDETDGPRMWVWEWGCDEVREEIGHRDAPAYKTWMYPAYSFFLVISVFRKNCTFSCKLLFQYFYSLEKIGMLIIIIQGRVERWVVWQLYKKQVSCNMYVCGIIFISRKLLDFWTTLWNVASFFFIHSDPLFLIFTRFFLIWPVFFLLARHF